MGQIVSLLFYKDEFGIKQNQIISFKNSYLKPYNCVQANDYYQIEIIT